MKFGRSPPVPPCKILTTQLLCFTVIEEKTMKVFEEDTVKDNPKFFLAGRGGETNLHEGNYDVRQRVLDNATAYAVLPPRERGQKFSQKVLKEDLQGFKFVVRLSYFWRNYENGKIASAKLESVVKEHGSLSALEGLPSTAYVTIGETWCLNIVGAILRQAAGKLDLNDPKPLRPKPPRKRGLKYKASQNTNRQPKKERDRPLNQPDVHSFGADMPLQDSEPNSMESSFSIPDDTSFLWVPKRPRVSRVSFGTIKLPGSAVPQANVLHKARRVSLAPSGCGNSSIGVSLDGESASATFYPICDQDKSERALVLPRLVSSSSMPPYELPSFGECQDYVDPLEYAMNDWDIEKWPQLDLHDLLAI